MAPVTEKIDERILRLLGLENEFQLSYGEYLRHLKEALSIIDLGKSKFSSEEAMLFQEEFKRIKNKNKEKRFNLKVKKEKITASKVATTKLLRPAKKTLALSPSQINVSEGGAGGFVGIRKTLDSILSTLGSKFKFDQKQADQDRKEKETEKRGKREASLEGFKKGVAGIVATTKKMLDPFQAIIDRIWRFIFFTLLGRAFTKFMEWMGDKGNQEKFNSFIEFLTDHWPALAGLYVLFGTSFGKLVRGLLKGATRMIVALVANSGKIKNFISKNKKLAFLGLAIAPLATRELGNLLGENKETPESGLIPTNNPELDQAKQSADKAANTKVPTLNFGGMIPSFKMGGMDFSGGVPITGAGQDDTLIAAKTGEAILTEKDQADLSQRYVDRNTGQPLNVPQYLAGRKPGSVAMSNIRFPGFGGGFFGGGMISKFNTGGIIGKQGGGNTYPTSPLTDYSWSSKEKEAYSQLPVEKTYKMDEHQILPKGFTDFMMPSWMKWNSVPDSPYPHTSYDKEDFEKGVKYNPLFQDLLRFPYLDSKPREDVDYKMYYAPEDYDRNDPEWNTIQAKGGGFLGLKKRRQGIGIIKENTGMDVRGATADRQHILAQPGEYVLPVDTVNYLGVSLIDRIVAMTDSNSNPYLGKGTRRRPQITPYNSFGSNGSMITLPPITQYAGGSRARSSGLGGGSEVPEFSAIAPANERSINASIYGLVG